MALNSVARTILKILQLVPWLLVASPLAAVDAPRTLKVGAYDNPPKIMLDEQGHLSGIFGDLLGELAIEHNWALTIVPCHWNSCLEMLANGEIDLMPDVALSDAREHDFDFHVHPVLYSWSQVYTGRQITLTSLLDLDGLRVVVLRASVQQAYLKQLADSFGLSPIWVQVDDIEQGFTAVLSGDADAVVASHYFGNLKVQSLDLKASPIMFQPSKLFFAVPRDRHADVLQAVDIQLGQWLADPDSVYYQILAKWTIAAGRVHVPEYIRWLLLGLLAALILVLVFSQALRMQVAQRTRSLRESEARLNDILNSVEACIYIKDQDLRYSYVNQKVAHLLGRQPDAIIGHRDEEFFDGKTLAQLNKNDLRVIEGGERLVEEEHNRLAEGGDEFTFLTVKIPLRDADGRINALCGISTDLSEQEAIRARLHRMEYSDALTGLANRAKLHERIRHALASYQRTHFEGAVVVMDIDDFKTLNETRSHNVGDELLQCVARRLDMHLREADTAARIGSDEFAWLIENLAQDRDEALMQISDLADALKQDLSRPYTLSSGNYTTTVSLGIALFSDAHDSADHLMKVADVALVTAKRHGRASLRFFNPKMQHDIDQRNQLETALRNAIDNEALALYLQPQYDHAQRLFGMEALLRWNDPEQGIISPADFIPVAEASGLIIPLGEWVLQRACQILSEWQALPELADISLSINVSPSQFLHGAFLGQVSNALTYSGINPQRLELEITESLLIERPDEVVERMNRLRELGLRFSLDDFGTGYASLSYLKLLPIYQLKIDQSFVRDLLTDTNDEAIISTIIALADSLQLQVIAEGVETPEQMHRLQQLGCHNFQGFYFGKPAPASHWHAQLIQNKKL